MARELRGLFLLTALTPCDALRPSIVARRPVRIARCAAGEILAFEAHSKQAELSSRSQFVEPPNKLLPFAVLLLVPVAWGTYGVAIKQLFALEVPPPELLFTLANYIVSSTALWMASLLFSKRRRGDASPAVADGDGGSSSDNADADDSPALRAGLELGAYLFLGSSFQIFGMRTTSASRGAFIVQLTTVITPLLDSLLLGNKPTPTELGGCLLALCGVALLVGESAANGAAAAVGMLSGEALIAISAIFYSLHVVRLSRLAPGLKPLKLARAKELARFMYAGITLLAAVLFSPAQAAALSAFIESAVASPVATVGGVAALALWTGVVTTAFPTWAQSFGQRSLDASTASVVYTTQPLWSALFGALLLNEHLTQQGMAGATVIFIALALVARKSSGAGERQEAREDQSAK